MKSNTVINVKHTNMEGKIFSTNGGTKCEIVHYESCKKVKVRFLDDFKYETTVPLADLRKGYVKNPFAPAVCGVGYLGVGEYSPSIDGKKTLAYVQWHGVVRRSYDLEYKNKQNSYKNTNMCEEWHCYNTYAEWFYQQKGWDKGFHLDKDILGNGNHTYSPETCCLVPAEINSLVSSGSVRKGLYAAGVTYSKKDRTFYAAIQEDRVYNHLGSFKTEHEAFLAYKKAKERRVKEVALLWKNEVDIKVFDALCNLEMTEEGWLSKEDSAFKFFDTGEVFIPKHYQDNLHKVYSEL